MTEHNGHAHLVELGHFALSNLAACDAPKAKLHIERCECGAHTVRPYEPELVERMRVEWGVRCVVDERTRDRVMSLTYDPAEREDFATDVWPEAALTDRGAK